MNLARNLESRDPMLIPPREAAYLLQRVLEKKVLQQFRDEVVLDLGDSFLRFGVDGDTDTVTSEFQDHPFRSKRRYRDVSGEKPWKRHVGRECGWTWYGINQQGYHDSVMLSFGEVLEPRVLLYTIGSSIKVFDVVPVKTPVAVKAH